MEIMQTLRHKDVGIISRNLLSYQNHKSKYSFKFKMSEKVSKGRSQS